jgi:AbrB family looped-hinge helix DNA binding protein
MIREEMKVGPKGQAVIPKVFRKYLGIDPGSNVVVALQGDKIHPRYGYDKVMKRRMEKVFK